MIELATTPERPWRQSSNNPACHSARTAEHNGTRPVMSLVLRQVAATCRRLEDLEHAAWRASHRSRPGGVLWAGCGGPEQITLSEDAWRKGSQLLFGFDAFDHAVQAHVPGQSCYGADDRCAGWIDGQAGGEGLVHLDSVDREDRKVAQAGVTRSEIVNGDADTCSVQLAQLAQGGGPGFQ